MSKDKKIGVGIGIAHCSSNTDTGGGWNPKYLSGNEVLSKSIEDTGSLFNHVTEKCKGVHILRMVHFSQDGWFLCSMKSTGGRGGEYRASWVYFPVGLSLKKKEINEIVESVEKQIEKRDEYNPTEIKNIITKYTKSEENNPKYDIPNEQKGYAFFALTPDNNLFDLYEKIYQKEFTKYEWVVLMEKEQIELNKRIEDISGTKLKEYQMLQEPSKEDLRGFTPWYKTSKMTFPFRLFEGDSIDVVFKRDEYKEFSKKITRQDDLKVSEEECLKKFIRSQFKAKCGNTTINEFEIIPSKEKFEKEGNEDVLYIPEKELKSVRFKITAEGYNADNYDIDLRDKKEIIFTLEPIKLTYVFKFSENQLVNIPEGRNVECSVIKVISQFPITECPFKGYRVNGNIKEGPDKENFLYLDDSQFKDENKTNPSNGKEKENDVSQQTTGYGNEEKKKTKAGWLKEMFWNKRWKRFLLLVLVILGVLFVLDKLGLFDGKEEKPEETPTTETANSDDPWLEASKYLEDHTDKVLREKMEKYPDLKNLYDLLNTYSFKSFKNVIDNHPHREDILKIGSWGAIYELANEIDSNCISSGQYVSNNDTDQSITFETYIDRINEKFLNGKSDSASTNKDSHGSQGSNGGENKTHSDNEDANNSSSQDTQNGNR